MFYPPALLLRPVCLIQRPRARRLPSSSLLLLLVLPQFRYVSVSVLQQYVIARPANLIEFQAICRFHANPPKKRQEAKRGRGSSLASPCRRYILHPSRLTKKRHSLFYCRSRYSARARTWRCCPRIPIQDERQQEAPSLSSKGSTLPSQL